MFARFNAATGALIADRIAQEPAPESGIDVVPMPPSAIAGLTVWSAEERGYIDRPPLTCLQFVDLWTPTETLAVMQTTSPGMAVAWTKTLASPIVELTDPRVIAGVELARTLGILTDARAARILAGLSPE